MRPLPTARDRAAQYTRDNHLDRPAIMGHSLGGPIALDLAAQYPQLVGPVVIVDSLPSMAGSWFRAETLVARAEIVSLRRVTSIIPEADSYSIAFRNPANVSVSVRQAKVLRDFLAL